MKMRKPVLAIVLAVAASQAAASQAAAEGNEEFKAAALQVAIAANCRATYGQHDLFEAAFSNFEAVAEETEAELSELELAEMKQELYDIEAEPEGNMFLEGFCKKLTAQLLPGSVSE